MGGQVPWRSRRRAPLSSASAPHRSPEVHPELSTDVEKHRFGDSARRAFRATDIRGATLESLQLASHQVHRHYPQAAHLEKTFIAHPTLMSLTMTKTATTQTVATLRKKKNLVFTECRTTSSLPSGQRAPNLRRSKQTVGLVAIELSRG